MSKRVAPAEVPNEVLVIPDEEDARVIDLTESIDPIDVPVVEDATRLDRGTRALRRYRSVGFVLVLIDALCLSAALLTAHAWRFGFLPAGDYMVGAVAAIIIWIGVFNALGLYTPHHLSWVEELRRTISAVGIGIVVVILVTFWVDVYLSRSWMAIALGIALALEVIARRIVRGYVHRQHASQSLVLRTIVIGNKEEAAEPIETLNRPGSGYLALGFVDASNPLIASEELSPIERVGHLRLLIQRHRPDCLFIASATIGTKQMLAALQAARQEGVLVRVYTHLSGIITSRVTVQRLDEGSVALTLRPAGLSAIQRIVKRAMDVVLAAVMLIVLSPFMLLVAAAVKLTSRGPVLFQQERIGQGGNPFEIYKFRTMTTESERPEDQRSIDTTVLFFKDKSDPRLTPLGRWLRRWSIDELPQLANVLMGDMSLVGPRPLAAEQVSTDWELLGPRHEVRPGITGWWQTQGRSDVGSKTAIEMDQFYIENWSPLLDVYIMFKTVGVLLTRRGAY